MSALGSGLDAVVARLVAYAGTLRASAFEAGSSSGGGAGAYAVARAAAVLVPLFERRGEVRVLLTRRADGMSSHGGEVSFAGGRRDEGDSSPADTALREAREEIGLSPAAARVHVTLPPLVSKHKLLVSPVIATVPMEFPITMSPDEVCVHAARGRGGAVGRSKQGLAGACGGTAWHAHAAPRLLRRCTACSTSHWPRFCGKRGTSGPK
jgi:hypothetical protein